MSTSVVGFRPPDEKWKKHKAVWDACAAAGVELPEETKQFFDGEEPDAAGVEIDLEDHPCCREYKNDGRQGFEILTAHLPKDVTVIRFFNSW